MRGQRGHALPNGRRICDDIWLRDEGKVVLYRDTGSDDPGSGPIFGSVSGSEIHILGIAYAKVTFSLY